MKLVRPTDRKCYSFNHKMFVSVDSNFTCITEINKNLLGKYSSIKLRNIISESLSRDQ